MHTLPVERHFMDSCGGSDAISQAGDRGGTLTHGGRPTMPSLPLVRPVHNMGFLSNAARTTFHRIPLHLCKGLSWEVTMEPKNHTKWDSSGCVCLWLFARMYVCMCLFVWLHNCIGEFGEVRPAWGQTSLTRSDPPPNISPPTPKHSMQEDLFGWNHLVDGAPLEGLCVCSVQYQTWNSLTNMKVGDSETQLKRHNQNSFNKKFLPYGKHFEILVNGDDIASAGKLFLF